MTQDLFPELIDKARHGTEWWAGRYQCRNWHGFFQSREEGRGNWLFYVEGFCDGPAGEEKTAHVARVVDRDKLRGVPCPIDLNNRVQIMGKRYGRDHWQH